ncbi:MULTISPECIES: TIGR03503 family protein [Pseudoalteromonas]|uniref:TIGR03503 family protein n=1 Tax=Pseudoalteromonas maricaloris TaxID=184924 RepID=A0A8I2H164_9GAMM|nr:MULTISPECIES: TIGR03503 family protein [Pseudoalteromonas]NLR19877.1 TIGR03503 family protein [Pseudoalteromonas maricaloris]RZG17098.1 TIGR03503 family protein [Pseudoalteromonas sp. CO342X]WMO12974.1 TIGR03503 family protein [Pseudoalteromonas piscicida]WOX27538.1 TIGR03503 family protein [Pseudoalteromonas maricaloris]
MNLKQLFLGFVLLVSTVVGAQTPQITMLQRDGKVNEIPLLDNRFRIDYNIEEITLLFFRAPGAPAVVLVKPDGSKYYATSSLDNDALQWYDEVSYDLIILKNPTPGPWQVIGQIQKNSRIMVLGDIELEVEALPPLLFRGEVLKVTGRVTNDGKPIDVGYFRDVVTLYVEFSSTNNDEYANFGAGTQSVTDFKDDGREFDERPLDGIFTGEFKLNFPAGEWQPEFFIETPILKRRVIKSPIVIAEPPFNFELMLAGENELEHGLTITIDDTVVKPETILLQGKIFYPNGEEQMFTLDAEERLYRQLPIKNYDWGRYSVEISAFGENINGREFMATLPNYNFEIERPIEKVPELEAAALPAVEQPEPEPEPTISTALLVSIIVAGNLVVLLLGWLAIRILVQKKPIRLKVPMPKNPFKKTEEVIDLDDLGPSENNAAGNGSKNDKSGDILNLSMKDN